MAAGKTGKEVFVFFPDAMRNPGIGKNSKNRSTRRPEGARNIAWMSPAPMGSQDRSSFAQIQGISGWLIGRAAFDR